VDPDWFPDPDKAFQVNADPDPDPGFLMTKNLINITAKKITFF
jgi:hypothetical protein